VENRETAVVPFWEVAVVFIIMFFVFLFVGVAVLLFFGDSIGLIFGELSVLLVPLAYLMYKRVDVKKYVKISFNPKFVLLGVACGGLLLVLNILVSMGLTAALGESTAIHQANEQYATLAASPLGLAAVATSLILAGIFEEFAFRGFLQNSIFKSLKKSKSTTFAFVVALL
jgi:membrane protease YdiL (CAAX protease family)